MADGISRQSGGEGRAQSLQEELRQLQDSIKMIDEPIDHGSVLEQNAGMIGYALNTVKSVGEIAGAAYDAATNTPTFSTAYGVASGVGNSVAGNHEEAGKEYVGALGKATGSPLIGVGAEGKELIEHLAAGEWAEAAGDAVDIVKGIGEVVAQPIHKIVDVIGAVASAEGNRKQFESGWTDDANHAASIANAENIRDAALERLTKLYWEKIEEARSLGIEPEIAPWMKPADYWDEKRVSAELADRDSSTARDAPARPERNESTSEPPTRTEPAQDSVHPSGIDESSTNGPMPSQFEVQATASAGGELDVKGGDGEVEADGVETGELSSETTELGVSDVSDSPAGQLEAGDATLADEETSEVDVSTSTNETDSDPDNVEGDGLEQEFDGTDETPSALDEIVGEDGKPSVWESAYAEGKDGFDSPEIEYETSDALEMESSGDEISTESGSGDASAATSDSGEAGSGDWSADPDAPSESESSSTDGGGSWDVGPGSSLDSGSSSDSGSGTDSSAGTDFSSGGDSSASGSDSSSSGATDGGGGDSGGGDTAV